MDGCGFVPVGALVEKMEQPTNGDEVRKIVERDDKVSELLLPGAQGPPTGTRPELGGAPDNKHACCNMLRCLASRVPLSVPACRCSAAGAVPAVRRRRRAACAGGAGALGCVSQAGMRRQATAAQAALSRALQCHGQGLQGSSPLHSPRSPLPTHLPLLSSLIHTAHQPPLLPRGLLPCVPPSPAVPLKNPLHDPIQAPEEVPLALHATSPEKWVRCGPAVGRCWPAAGLLLAC